MKKFIIKLFGGYTPKEFRNLKQRHKNQLYDLRHHVFRKDDIVYIKDSSKFDPFKPYYLLEPYNNGFCWYVSQNKNDTQRRELVNGVHVYNLDTDRPAIIF